MSRKVILTLAAAATVAAATLATSSASYARGVHFGGGGGHVSGPSHFASANHFARVNHFPRLHDPRDPGRHIGLHEHHRHWAFRNGIWIEVDDVDAADTVDVAPAVTPGPCTCLTKNYTPTGLVVFADICTKESASAPVDGTADATQAPTTPAPVAQAPAATATPSNFAGRTYQDYLAANPQAAAQAPAKN
ncbi:MAG: hypothetical protein WB760_04555 [Xanthobacteraceae bacterium]